MKKGILKVLSVITALIAVFSLASCQGEQGLSAYEIAVENGFVGTEAQWLQSLKGLNGQDGEDLDINQMYEAAIADGFSGSMADFLKEYFSVDVEENSQTEIIAHNVMSSVEIICTHQATNIYGQTVDVAAQGSGVIYYLEKEEGRAYIITNYHVVHEETSIAEDKIATGIYMYLYGAMNGFTTATYTDTTGDPLIGRFVGGSKENDIAVIAVEDSEYLKTSAAEAVKVRDEEKPIRVGEEVHAIGNASGNGTSVTQGVISVDSEYISLPAIGDSSTAASHRVMRTDSAINKGNSGGGLFDANGKLVGIVNAKSSSTSIDNVGYAIPIDRVCRIADKVIETGKATKGLFGITVSIEDSRAYVDEFGVLQKEETIVVSVAPTSTTQSAYGKLIQGDVIKEITLRGQTKKVTRLHQVSELLIAARAGDTATLVIERAGEEKEISITFEESHIVEN
ncbi:MAG: trypsin-like peptidase domain-containing protein [Clostridia bacterium]|nr:trypsin-like peptidase domain-containing protein [Clostridia bacterium]